MSGFFQPCEFLMHVFYRIKFMNFLSFLVYWLSFCAKSRTALGMVKTPPMFLGILSLKMWSDRFLTGWVFLKYLFCLLCILEPSVADSVDPD